MKNVFKGLKVNENDSKLKANAKRGAKLVIIAGTIVGAGLGALKLLGKTINNSDEMEAFEYEMRAE